MSLTLTVPDDIARAAMDAAHIAGLSQDQVLLAALRAHFPPVPSELAAEFAALERASDEDFAAFAAAHGL